MSQPNWNLLALEAVRWRHAKQPARAIECLLQSLAITRQMPELDDETGTNLNYLADTYLQEGFLLEAEAAIREALNLRLRRGSEDQILAAGDYMILARVLSKQGRQREAVTAGKQGLAIFTKLRGRNDPYVKQVRQLVEEIKLGEKNNPSGDSASPAA